MNVEGWIYFQPEMNPFHAGLMIGIMLGLVFATFAWVIWVIKPWKFTFCQQKEKKQ